MISYLRGIGNPSSNRNAGSLGAIVGFVCPNDKDALSIVPDLDIENAFRYDPELRTDKQREEILDLLTEELADRSR